MFKALSRQHIVLALVIGIIAGILAGLFGVGGGFIMVPLFIAWVGLNQRRSHATSLAAVIPIATAGSLAYAATGDVVWNAAFALLAGSIFGALYGVKLLHQIPMKFLQLGFATLLTLSAIRLIWSSQPDLLIDGPGEIVLLIGVGFFAGVMSGLFGVGGGIVMVPALIIAAGVDAIQARGTSLVVIVGSGLSGTWANYRKGNIDTPYAILSGIAGIPAVFLGVFLSHSLPERISVILFTFILLSIALQQFRRVFITKAEH